MKNEYKQLNPVTNKDDIGVAINLLIQDNIKKARKDVEMMAKKIIESVWS